MFSKNKILFSLLIIILIITSTSLVSAMEIQGGAFSTDDGMEDLTYASIDVGSEYSGDDIIIQIWYSRDGSTLNHGNMVPITVTSDGFANVRSADAYTHYPDHAEVNIYDTDNNLLDSQEVDLSPSSGIQTFGYGDYDDTYLTGSDSDTSSSYSSSSGSSTSSYNTGTSDSYVGNLNSGKFHAPGCGDVSKMKDSNKVYFSSRDEAVGSGYSPCGHCSP